MAVGVGAVGVAVAVNLAAARSTRILGNVPLNVFPIGAPVLRSAPRISATPAEGLTDFSTAHAPETCGAAMDVPLIETISEPALPGNAEAIATPGASKSRYGAVFEVGQTVSDLNVAPTLIADEMHPGEVSDVLDALFPEATTVAMPAERRPSIAAFNARLLASQAPWSTCCSTSARLMFTAATGDEVLIA